MTKIFLILAMTFGLYIPLAMVESVIEERQERRATVVAQLGAVWGLPQTIAGPYLEKGPGQAMVTATRVQVRGQLQTEVRNKGIYRIPFYSADLVLEGEFPPVYGVQNPILSLRISDKKAVEVTSLVVDGKPLAFTDRGTDADGIAMVLPGSARSFKLVLKLQGIERLNFRPSGRTTVELSGNWGDPSFTGAHLPISREIESDSFSAKWDVRGLPGSPALIGTPPAATAERGEVARAASPAEDFSSAFGVNLFLPVDIYQQATRSVKYGLLFVGLTFLAFFLFEVLANLRIHPVQYLLVGSALVIFYLLLLSLSEQIGFLFAYMGGSLATIGLITAYSWSVLRQGGRALLLGFLLVLLYGFLFTLLQMEEYSLLLGSLALFLILALVMFLTRSIDWYNLPGRGTEA